MFISILSSTTSGQLQGSTDTNYSINKGTHDETTENKRKRPLKIFYGQTKVSNNVNIFRNANA
jgi:hypothetical protein